MKRLALLILICPIFALAQQPQKKRVGLDAASNIRINYGRASWNKSPTEFDTASILMREGASGRTVQISLVESAPDSAIFSGLYKINFKDMQQLETEFYIPEQERLGKPDGLKKVLAEISAGKLVRNPFILRRQPTGLQSVEIFDSKEQAREALKAYKAEQQVGLQGGVPVKFPSDQAVETAAMAQQLKEKAEQLAAAAERQRLSQIEAKRVADLQAEQARMGKAEREARKKQAASLAAEGMALFKQEKYAEAKGKFDQAIDLDPDNQFFYYQYGVTLFRVEDFNRALVILKLASGPTVNTLERDYFVGLSHFRLKEYDNSVAAFDRIVAANDPAMSPSAEFYKGVVLFEQRKWESAQAAFQGVLDKSNDPKLDERAEAYLEQILRIRQAEEEAKRKWFLTATIGEQYDSNVLLSPDSSTSGTATNSAGYRSLITGSVRHRALYEETREFAAQFDLTTMYTVSSSFQGDQSLRNADPTVLALTLPYTHKGLFLGKGHKLDMIPGYESTFMSIENNETKEILGSFTFAGNNLIVMNETWFSNYNMDARVDTSKLTSSTGDDDSTAIKVKFSTSHILLVSDDKTRILIPDGAYTQNEAKGKNAIYNRFDLGLTYLRPWKWETTTSFKLGFYTLNYPQNATGRTDNSYTFTTSLSKKLNDIWSSGLTGSYNVNQSNVSANQYNKFTLMLTFTAATGF